jgi:hypothetical protein
MEVGQYGLGNQHRGPIKGGLGEASGSVKHKSRLMFRALGTAHSPFWSTTLWMRELNLLKVNLGTVLVEANMEILLDVSRRGAAGEETIQFNLRSIATDRQLRQGSHRCYNPGQRSPG